MRVLLIIISLLTLVTAAYTQNESLETIDRYIFWEPDIVITAEDYKGEGHFDEKEYLEEMGSHISPCIGLWSIIDVPEKISNRGEFLEKVYFVPFFDKNCSFFITNDSLQISYSDIYLDMAEVCARRARRNLQHLSDTISSRFDKPLYGTLYFNYSNADKFEQEYLKRMYYTFTKEVLKEKIEGAYQKWRKLLAGILKETEEWATTPDDCYRMVSQKPIEPNYIMPELIPGPDHASEKNKGWEAEKIELLKFPGD